MAGIPTLFVTDRVLIHQQLALQSVSTRTHRSLSTRCEKSSRTPERHFPCFGLEKPRHLPTIAITIPLRCTERTSVELRWQKMPTTF